jgi:hypothetical protein
VRIGVDTENQLAFCWASEGPAAGQSALLPVPVDAPLCGAVGGRDTCGIGGVMVRCDRCNRWSEQFIVAGRVQGSNGDDLDQVSRAYLANCCCERRLTYYSVGSLAYTYASAHVSRCTYLYVHKHVVDPRRCM